MNVACNQAKQILKTLKKEFRTTKKQSIEIDDPFKTLIATIISQNTNDKNATRAFTNLSNRFEITPEVLAYAETSEVQECLRIGGLYNAKTNAIRRISREILDKYAGSLSQVLSMSSEEARKDLMLLSNVGPKTADVVLLFSARKHIIPVDTHVNRVSKRLWPTSKKDGYEDVRNFLQTIFKPEDYLAVHLLLIAQGRTYCKAYKPLCPQCPISRFCPSRMNVKKND